MLAPEPKQIKQTERPTSLSISPSRSEDYANKDDIPINTTQGTNKRTQHQLELEIENMGGHLNAYTSVCPCATDIMNHPLTFAAREHCLLCQIRQLRRSENGRHSI